MPTPWKISSGLTEATQRYHQVAKPHLSPYGVMAIYPRASVCCLGPLGHRSELSLRCYMGGECHRPGLSSGPSELPIPPRSVLSLTNLNVERLPTIDCCLIILESITELVIGQAVGLIWLSLPETKSSTQSSPNRGICLPLGIWIHLSSRGCLKILFLSYWPGHGISISFLCWLFRCES